jgi:tetratricopeptide (TPR) repeat protein
MSVIKKLETPDLHHLKAAEGWLELGDVVSASNELEEITPQMRAHPAVLSLRYEIYSKAKKWDIAAEIARALTQMLPNEPSAWISLAYSTRRKSENGILEARDILLQMESKFPREYLFPYNLACYHSQLMQFEEAERWFKKAMAIDTKAVQKLAVIDEDLKPFFDSMSGTLWKRE